MYGMIENLTFPRFSWGSKFHFSFRFVDHCETTLCKVLLIKFLSRNLAILTRFGKNVTLCQNRFFSSLLSQFFHAMFLHNQFLLTRHLSVAWVLFIVLSDRSVYLITICTCLWQFELVEPGIVARFNGMAVECTWQANCNWQTLVKGESHFH